MRSFPRQTEFWRTQFSTSILCMISVQIEVWQKVCRFKNTSSHAYRGWIRGISYFLCLIPGTKKTICKNILDNLEHFQDFKSSFQDVKSLKARRRRRVHRDCRCKDTGQCTCNPVHYHSVLRKPNGKQACCAPSSGQDHPPPCSSAVQLSLTLVLVVIKICLPPTNQPIKIYLEFVQKSWISKIKDRFRIIQVFADQDSKKCTFCCRIQDILTNSWIKNKKSTWIVQDALPIRFWKTRFTVHPGICLDYPGQSRIAIEISWWFLSTFQILSKTPVFCRNAILVSKK